MTFLYPYVLIALLLPALLAAGIIYAHKRSGAGWRLLVSRAHPELVQSRPRWQTLLPPTLALLALVGIILASARPINGYGRSEATATGRNLLIALDVSRSMETQDVTPSRLEEARAAAYELIDALPGDKIGLIVFAGEADVVVPLTYDHTALRDALEQVNRDWAGYGGTNFGLLLRAAMQNFARSAPDGANALVILSDGEDTVDSSLEIAEEARKNNLLVITVGIGTPAGGAIPDPEGENGLWQDASGRHVISKLDINALQRFASATGGDFFTMNSGADLTAFAREAANKLSRHEESYAAGLVPLDLFAWFAVPSLLLLLLSILLNTEWRAPKNPILRALLIGALLSGAQAQGNTHADAYAAGLHAMQSGEKQTALEQISTALLSKQPELQAAAHLALGNIRTRTTFDKLRALYNAGDDDSSSSPATRPQPSVENLQDIVDELKDDISSYRDALAADSTLSAAQRNIDHVEALIRKIEEEIERLKQQQQQNKQDNQGNSDQDKKNSQDKQDDQGNSDQDKKDSQDKQDDQGNSDQNKKDSQDKQDDQGNSDQDKKNSQDNSGGEDNRSPRQGEGETSSPKPEPQQDNAPQSQSGAPQEESDNAADMQAAEPTEEEKSKQRAAGILRMHLDEEKGSPIPHFDRPVRPPSKDY